MTASNIIKLALAVLLGVAWFALVLLGKTGVDPFVAFIQGALVSLGAHVLTMVAPAPAAPKDKEAGFAMLRMLGVVVLLVVMGSTLAGCAGTFGHTSYTVKANTAGGYDFEAGDGKEYATGRSIAFSAANGSLMISEGASTAFTGQALGVKAINILPTMGLGDILAPQDK